jgi:hypothetical protein
MPNTVRAPRTPLYQLGWLGQDDGSEDVVYGPPETIDTAALNADTGLGPTDSSESYSDFLTNPNLIPTTPTTGIGPAMGPVPTSGGTATFSLTSALTSLFAPKPATALAPGPSPRVVTAAPATLSLGSALPMLAIGAIGIVLLTSLGGGRRRRR